jgi:hypothetical protein
MTLTDLKNTNERMAIMIIQGSFGPDVDMQVFRMRASEPSDFFETSAGVYGCN